MVASGKEWVTTGGSLWRAAGHVQLPSVFLGGRRLTSRGGETPIAGEEGRVGPHEGCAGKRRGVLVRRVQAAHGAPGEGDAGGHFRRRGGTEAT